jgi:hypothetical protein
MHEGRVYITIAVVILVGILGVETFIMADDTIADTP